MTGATRRPTGGARFRTQPQKSTRSSRRRLLEHVLHLCDMLGHRWSYQWLLGDSGGLPCVQGLREGLNCRSFRVTRLVPMSHVFTRCFTSLCERVACSNMSRSLSIINYVNACRVVCLDAMKSSFSEDLIPLLHRRAAIIDTGGIDIV
ncbi:hypothetical protein FKP32DRAFT_986581 [Trametes sanguinea]|nr:hypothetical protein FKP32DRAFT_986581 [Trametes sanguinea]